MRKRKQKQNYAPPPPWKHQGTMIGKHMGYSFDGHTAPWLQPMLFRTIAKKKKICQKRMVLDNPGKA